jgi:hypothetical protein
MTLLNQEDQDQNQTNKVVQRILTHAHISKASPALRFDIIRALANATPEDFVIIINDSPAIYDLVTQNAEVLITSVLLATNAALLNYLKTHVSMWPALQHVCNCSRDLMPCLPTPQHIKFFVDELAHMADPKVLSTLLRRATSEMNVAVIEALVAKGARPI